MSSWLPTATIAIEDKRFYQHGGIDYVGIMRALWSDLSAGKVVQGGSTITQQLVRNLYTGSQRTFQRKIKEACLAIKLSDKLSKQQILEEYLNTVYYGNHAYGVAGRRRDVLLEAGVGAEPPPGLADRRVAPGALGRRPVPRSPGGNRSPQRGAAGDGERRNDHACAGALGGEGHEARPEAGPHLHDGSGSPTSSHT